MAPAWVAMCQPSASSAIELNQEPAAISTTMVIAVSPTTIQVRRSCRVVLAAQEIVSLEPGFVAESPRMIGAAFCRVGLIGCSPRGARRRGHLEADGTVPHGMK